MKENTGFVAKHRLQQPTTGAHTARNIAIAGVLAAGAAGVASTAPAMATTVTIPGIGTVNIPDAPAPNKTAKPAATPAAAHTKTAHTKTQNSDLLPGARPVSATTTLAGGYHMKAVDAALSRVGDPYVYGAAGPNAFDCSGLMYWSYKQAGKSLPRDSWGQLGGGTRVSSIADLQPGDIVIYDGGNHVGMYIGGGRVVHAPTSGQSVKVVPVNQMSIYAMRRY